MIRLLGRSGSALLVVSTVFTLGCNDAPPMDMDWAPVIETTSTPYLWREVVRAQSELEKARASLRADTGAVREHLDATEVHLQRLRDVYLPLLDAQARARNAYRLQYLGRDADAISELARIRTMIVAVSHQKSGRFRAELDRIRELEADARAQLEARSPSATDGLRELALALDGIMDRAEAYLESGG